MMGCEAQVSGQIFRQRICPKICLSPQKLLKKFGKVQKSKVAHASLACQTGSMFGAHATKEMWALVM
jgi:ADP-ribosylglycohydrolase